MADLLVSVATEKIKEAAVQRAELFLGAADEFQKLCFTFQSIQAVLHDAETKQITDENVRLWLWRLKQVAYDIDDLVDEEMISDLIHKDNDQDDDDDSNFHNKVSALTSKLREWVLALCSRYEIAVRVKEMRENLDQIADDKNKYGFINIGAASGSSSSSGGGDGSRRPPTTSFQESSDVIGREKDREILTTHLVSHEEGFWAEKVPVVVIQGVGGLGKTTIAREVYNHKNIAAHFNQKIWVCVTENYKVERITKAILEQSKKEGTTVSELQAMQMEVFEALKNKRFLLVLDDVWNDNEGKWKELRPVLTSGAAGSKILVTTRSEKVATAMHATYIHPLGGLSDDDCWEIFRSSAFAGRTKEQQMELEEVGKKIVEKCNRVPLSVRVMGSAMQSKPTADDWENILMSPIWSLPEAATEIIRPLFLSYSNLPPHLKRCFAYCSVYPKDEVMEKDKLIRLWIAQDFIKSVGNKRDIEDIGEEYFNQLVDLSMFQEIEKDELKSRCKMHDLLHDLAQFIMKDECGIFESGDSGECSISIRHASFFLRDDSHDDVSKPCEVPSTFYKLKKLRTLFLDGSVRKEIDASLVAMIFDAAPFLRALHVNRIGILSETIGELKHLRYLDLSNSEIVELPKSVTHLPMLHTLNLNSCKRLKRLPSDIGRMVRLKHLEIQDTSVLECLPTGMGRIHSLRSLSKFIVGGEGGCGIDELQQLNSLKGILGINHLEKVPSGDEARKAQLRNKLSLRTLGLHFFEDGEDSREKVSDTLEGLKPPQSLEKLIITFKSSSPKLPSWTEDRLSLPKLTELKIKGDKDTKNPRGKFFSSGLPRLPKLKKLDIECIYDKQLPDEGWEELESLEQLTFHSCKKLESLPDGLGQLKALKSLELSLLTGLFHLPAGLGQLQSLEQFVICDCYQLECLPDELGQLKALKSLTLSLLTGLFHLPAGLGQLQSLEEFVIRDCYQLEFLPDELGQLKTLKTLGISCLVALASLLKGLGQLESLERFFIDRCPRLESLPDELGQLKALNTLSLDCLRALASLPAGMAQLKALQTFLITECGALGSLPPGLQDLPLLRRVEINFCPLLELRYEREGDHGWPNVDIC